jgi:hypothetical protein
MFLNIFIINYSAFATLSQHPTCNVSTKCKFAKQLRRSLTSSEIDNPIKSCLFLVDGLESL